MPLDLKDPRWNELSASYGNSTKVVEWLAEARDAGTFVDDRLGDLINEVAHQGDASPALYAVVPHLVDLASRSEAQEKLELLIHAGLLCADTGRLKAPKCPEFLVFEFQRSSQAGAQMLAPLLAESKDFETYKYAVAALAGLTGYLEFGRFLDGLELYEDQFHHPWFETPVPARD